MFAMGSPQACADLCAAKGFLRQAEFLRALAASGGRVYVVVANPEPDFEVCDIVDHGPHPDLGTPQAVFLTREKADRDAEERFIRACRDENPSSEMAENGLRMRFRKLDNQPFLVIPTKLAETPTELGR
jgi:hypothetical protein